MKKPTIVIMRTGSVLYVGDAVHTSPSKSEGRDTLGMVEYLADAGYKVILFGRIISKNFRDDIEIVQPNIDGIDEWATIKEMETLCIDAAKQLAKFKPDVCINTVGACPTTSWPDNPRGSAVQAFALRYLAPSLKTISLLRLPRVCVITDIRNYPKDQEMLFMPHVKPIAVLSQEHLSFPRKLYERKFMIHARYAACENWFLYGLDFPKNDGPRQYDCGICAHTHFTDGRLAPGRAEAWTNLLDEAKFDYWTCGTGWDEEGYQYCTHPGTWKGEWTTWKPKPTLGLIKDINDVYARLSQTLCGPMISMRPSFNSCKLAVYARCGALPLPYGRFDGRRIINTGFVYDKNGKSRRCISPEEYCTYDGAARYVPLDSELRVTSHEDIARLIQKCKREETWRKDHIRKLVRKTEPNFSILEECISRVAAGERDMYDKFGGYEEM